MLRLLVSQFVVLILPLLAFADYDWTLERVDRVGPGSRSVEVKVDTQGKIHMAYAGCASGCKETALWYAVRHPDGQWKRELVDDKTEDVGRHANVEFESNGTIHILYGDKEKQYLRWAYLKPGSRKWKTKRISPTYGGSWVRTVRYEDTIYVSHARFDKKYMNEEKLELGIYHNGKWSFQVLEKGGWTTSIAVTPWGAPVISSHDGPYFRGHTHLTYWQDGTWKRQPIDGISTKSDVVVDSNGFFHVVYCKTDETEDRFDDIFYTTNAPDGKWKRHLLAGGENKKGDVFFPSIAIDQKDTLHVSYRDYEKNLLGYARKQVGDKWKFSVIEKMGRPLYSRLFVGPDKKVHLALENLEQIYYGVCSNCTD